MGALLDIGPTDASKANSIDGPATEVDRNLWFAEIAHAGAEAFNGLQWLSDARARHLAIIVDLGHSTGSLQRQLSAAADWLLWVVVPDRSGLQRADAALASGALSAARAGLIFNRVRRGCLEGAEAALAGRHQLPVLGRFAEDRQVADRLIRGLPVHRMWSLRRPLRELAKSIQPDAAGAVLAWR